MLYPSDEFGAQELPSAQVPAFVAKQGLPTEGGGCTLMEKVKVNGPEADPAWKLAKSAFPGDIGWNFAGIFLFDPEGTPVGKFGSRDLKQVDAKLAELVASCTA